MQLVFYAMLIDWVHGLFGRIEGKYSKVADSLIDWHENQKKKEAAWNAGHHIIHPAKSSSCYLSCMLAFACLSCSKKYDYGMAFLDVCVYAKAKVEFQAVCLPSDLEVIRWKSSDEQIWRRDEEE